MHEWRTPHLVCDTWTPTNHLHNCLSCWTMYFQRICTLRPTSEKQKNLLKDFGSSQFLESTTQLIFQSQTSILTHLISFQLPTHWAMLLSASIPSTWPWLRAKSAWSELLARSEVWPAMLDSETVPFPSKCRSLFLKWPFIQRKCNLSGCLEILASFWFENNIWLSLRPNARFSKRCHNATRGVMQAK